MIFYQNILFISNGFICCQFMFQVQIIRAIIINTFYCIKMSDVNMQLPTNFSQIKGNFQISLSIQESTKSLKISLVHISTCETFEKTITQEYIDEQSQFINLIDDPQFLYITMIKIFNDVMIDQKGSISFPINSGKKPRSIVIATDKIQCDKLDKFSMQNQKLRKDINAKFQSLSSLFVGQIKAVKMENQKLTQLLAAQNDKLMKSNETLKDDLAVLINRLGTKIFEENKMLKEQLKEQNDKLFIDFTGKIQKMEVNRTADNQKLKQQMISENDKIMKQSDKLKIDLTAKLQSQLSQLKNKISQLTTEISTNIVNKSPLIISMSANTNILMQQVKQIKKQLEVFKKQYDQLEWQIHFNLLLKRHNGNQEYLIIKQKQQNKCFIKKIGKNQYFNFISSFGIPFPFGQTTKITIKIIQLFQKQLVVGIGTNNMFGINQSSHKDLLSLNYSNGRVFEYDVRRQLGTLKLDNGDVIEMIVNRSSNVVTWLTNGIKIAESPINEHFKNQTLHLIINTYYNHDNFQINW